MRKKLNIEGMHCENCVRGLRDVLTEDVSGVLTNLCKFVDGFDNKQI